LKGVAMKKFTKKSYINTTLDIDTLTALKVLAAKKGMRINQLLEEAINLLLKKHEKESE
jgi:hypothetical protein